MSGHEGTKMYWWTPIEELLLKKLTKQGLSARQIASKMRRTRGSIIGKWKRMRDDGRNS